MKGIAYARRWFIDGEKAVKVKNENGRLAWPFKFKLLEITQLNALPDDEPLVTLAEAEAEVKQARIDALELAMEMCRNMVTPNLASNTAPYSAYELACVDCETAIESLKGAP